MSTSGRIGCFFLIVGAMLVVLFLASDSAKAPVFGLLLGGLVGLGLGALMWRRGSPPPRPSERFSLVNRLRGRKSGAGSQRSTGQDRGRLDGTSGNKR